MREEFMIERNGKRFVLYAGLLEEAHNLGLKEIDTDLIQIPVPDGGQTGEEVAIVKATVVMADERKFTGIGDASPQNVNRAIAPHLIRMAETRAKARALRDAINVGVTAFEELGSYEEGGAGDAPSPDETPGVTKGGAQKSRGGPNKIRKHQADLLKTLAEQWRGEEGVERLEKRLGKPIEQLTRAEADEWIDRLTPEGRE